MAAIILYFDNYAAILISTILPEKIKNFYFI